MAKKAAKAKTNVSQDKAKQKLIQKLNNYKKPVNTLYKQEQGTSRKAFQGAKKAIDEDNPYYTLTDKRRKANKKIGISNYDDRIAKTPTERVYSVSKHYTAAINGVKGNAQNMVNGQKRVNQANAAETIRRAAAEGASANHQNDVRYTEAKHQVANDSATTRNKLSANHAQNLNKITTNTAANVASAKASQAKADANSDEAFYKFKTSTLKDMRVARIQKRQEQRNNDKSLNDSYRQTRRSASINRKKQTYEYKHNRNEAKYQHQQNMKKINLDRFNTIASAKYTSIASVNKAIKKVGKNKKDKNRKEKLATLYKIKTNLLGTAAKSSGSSSGGSGRRRSGRRYYYSGGRRYYRSGGYSSSGGSSGGNMTPNRGKSGGKHGGKSSNHGNISTKTYLKKHNFWTDAYPDVDAAFREHARQRTAAARKHLRHRKRGGDQKMLKIYNKHPGRNYW